MPIYLYRREDGTTFEFRQKFADEPLTLDPATGQPVKRVVQAAGIVFKGSGFYVNDSKDASRKSINTTAKNGASDNAPASSNGASSNGSSSDSAAPAASEKTSAKEAAPAKSEASAAPAEK